MHSHPEFLLTLCVRDLQAVTAFYQLGIGLEVLGEHQNTVTLGVGATAMLTLEKDAGAAADDAATPGLFHAAFLLPSRADLADWLSHALLTGVTLQGLSDHKVSEAIYLSDPEGNGIEIYADRPSAHWERDGPTIAMGTARLDVENLLRDRSADGWRGAPPGTRLGHVHLRTDDLVAAEGFWTGQAGLTVTCRYPGATFLALPGYHHHVAVNIWGGVRASTCKSRTTGFRRLDIRGLPGPAARLVTPDGLTVTRGGIRFRGETSKAAGAPRGFGARCPSASGR